jgi:hypothetical protein
VSDRGRWRRWYCADWHEAAFKGLTWRQRVIAAYVRTGPQSTSVGIFRLSAAVAVEDLAGDLTSVEFDFDLDVVCQAFGWRFDAPTRVLWMPEWLEMNPAQSPNVCDAWRKLLSNLPECELKYEAWAAVYATVQGMKESFRSSFGTLPKEGLKGFRKKASQKASQIGPHQGSRGSGDQGISGEREKVARFARAGERKPPDADASASTDASSELPAYLVQATKQTLKLTSPKQPLADLCDAVRQTLRHEKHPGDVTTETLKQAITAELNRLAVS